MKSTCTEEHLQDTDMWAARLRSFACRTMSCPVEQEVGMVREAAQLLDAGAAVLDVQDIDFVRLEAMLACNASDSAVLALMPRDIPFMLSRGPGSACLATVIAGNGAEEVICEGSTVALALLTAYVSALLVPLEQRGEMCRSLAIQPLSRLN